MSTIIRSKRASKESSRVQIVRLDKREKILEVNDALSVDPKKNKLHVKLVQYGQAPADVEHWVDTDLFKTLAKLILAGRLEQVLLAGPKASPKLADFKAGKRVELWADYKGSTRGGVVQARVLTLSHDPSRDLRYVLAMQNGHGEVMGEGAVRMTKGGVIADLSIALSALDLTMLASEVLDYVRDWEVRNFQARQESQTVTIVPMTCDPGVDPGVQQQRRRIAA